jgi:hypothetical protein
VRICIGSKRCLVAWSTASNELVHAAHSMRTDEANDIGHREFLCLATYLTASTLSSTTVESPQPLLRLPTSDWQGKTCISAGVYLSTIWSWIGRRASMLVDQSPCSRQITATARLAVLLLSSATSSLSSPKTPPRQTFSIYFTHNAVHFHQFLIKGPIATSMGGAPEPTGTPPPVIKGMATLATLRFVFLSCHRALLTRARVGVKAMVEKVYCLNIYICPKLTEYRMGRKERQRFFRFSKEKAERHSMFITRNSTNV